ARDEDREVLRVGSQSGAVLVLKARSRHRQQRDVVLARQFLNEIVVAQVSASERKRKSVGEIENAHGCCPVVVSEASQARPGDPTCAATGRNSGFRAATRRFPSRCAGARDHRRTASEAVCSYSAPSTAQTAA